MIKFIYGLFIIWFVSAGPGFATERADSVDIMKKLVATGIDPDLKIKYLSKLTAAYWQADPDSSLWFGWQGLPLLNEKVSPRRSGNLYFVLGMAWENKGHADSAMWYLVRAREDFTKEKEKRYYFRAVEQIGSLYRIMGQYDSAIVLMNSALEYFKSTGNQFQVMSTLFNIGSVYFEQNRLNKALEYYLASAAYDSLLGDTAAIATHHLGIGNVYLQLAELFSSTNPAKSGNYYALSREQFRKSIALFNPATDKTGACFSLMSLLATLIGEGEYASADSLLNAVSWCENFPDPRVRSGFILSQANLCKARGENDRALKLFSAVALEKGEVSILPEYHQAMLQMAGLLWKKGERDSAQRLADLSFVWGKENAVYPVVCFALDLKTGWFRSAGEHEKALGSFTLLAQYKDSLYAQIGHEIFDETELRFRNQLLQAKVVAMEADQKMLRSRDIMLKLAGATALLVLLMIIGVLLVRHRNTDRKRLVAEQNRHLAEQERLLREKDIENLQLEMQLKEQELIFHSLKSADLAQVNRSIREKLGEFQFRFAKKGDQERFTQTLSEIHREAKQEPMADFELLFGQMHSGFNEKLLAKCPSLSRTELQICALLRMNLSTKDISRLINITAASVDVYRSHIRKKLALEQNQNLTSCLIMMG